MCISLHTHTGVFDIKELFVLDYVLVKYYACLHVSLFLSLCVQEPGPAKVTVTSTSSSSSMVCLPSTIAHAERVPSTRATLWQEETWSRATLPTSCSTGSLSQLGTQTQNSFETNKVTTCCLEPGCQSFSRQDFEIHKIHFKFKFENLNSNILYTNVSNVQTATCHTLATL